jgi:putative transposase
MPGRALRSLAHGWRGRRASESTKEPTAKFRGRVLSATVKREADRWYLSLAVERERSDPTPVQGPVVGVDLGLNCFAALSDGTRVRAPKSLARNLRRLRHRSRAHSRKRRGSANHRKSALALARLHRRIRNQRLDFLHKLTTRLARTKSVIVVEDLAVAEMVRTRPLAWSIADAGGRSSSGCWATRPSGTGRGWSSGRAFTRPRGPSLCGAVKPELPLAERVFHCETCGSAFDRDLNTALKLARLVAGGSPQTQNACGADVT